MNINKTGIRTDRPSISHEAYSQVSSYRQSSLQKEHSQGLWRDGVQSTTTSASFLATASDMSKTAQMATSSGTPGSGDWRGSSSTMRQMPDIYSPLWLNSNLTLPRDLPTINAWSRAFYALQSFVQNAINLHSTYPISKLNIKCGNKKVQSFFEQMAEEIDLENVCMEVAQEFWLLGEAFPYCDLDQTTGKWRRIFLQNPDNIIVKNNPVSSEPIIMLRPDPELQRLVRSNKPADIMQRNALNETIVAHLRRGENIPIDNYYISHIARKISPYATRGTGLLVSCFRQLALFDQLRECKYVQAQDMVNPVTLVKIGSADYKATPEDLEVWRNSWAQSLADKNFKIFTHEAVTVEKIGSNSAVMDTSADITQLLNEIFMGLFVPQVIMTGGGDITYANGGISLDTLRSRYLSFRNMMSRWLKNKIFAPISQINDFYDTIDGEKRLIVPDIEWNRLTMFDTMDNINVLMQLSTGQDKRVSKQALYDSLGLDFAEEQRKIRREDIQEAIREKEKTNLAKMNLNDLRSLGEDDEIQEALDTPNATDSPYSGGLPGQVDPNAGGGGGGGGMSMPDLGSLGAPPSAPPPPPPPA